VNKPIQNSRESLLRESLTNRVLVLDGATGTYLQDQNLTAEDFGGAEYEGCNENLVLTRPDIISGMHAAYLEAGADIVETDTFGGTPLVLGEFGLATKAREINRRAAELAREQATRFSTPDRPRFVAGSIGPTTKAISVTGGITFAELEANFHEQALGLLEGGADYLLVETSQDTRNIKAALLGIDRARRELNRSAPVAVSCTIEPMGTMLAGQGVEAFYASIMHHDLLYVGLNCATGPAFMTDHVRSLAALAKVPVAVMPNAGLPDVDGHYLETPQMMTTVLERFLAEGWVNLIGGCCGTTGAHIAAFSGLVAGKPPRVPQKYQRSIVSGIDFLEIAEDNRPIIVGERTNAVGSRLFRRMIEEEKFDEASDIARRQVNGGAQIIDINLANPDRDELSDMRRFLEQVIQKVKVPLMIDSTDAQVIAEALPYSQGKAVINSVNLEDGEERFERVVPLAKAYGAALIVGTIDEDPNQGMAVTRQRKLEVARRSYDLLVNKYGMAPEDLIFDPLVFPCATGDENYVGSAAETIEGVRMIKEAFPACKTVLGVSNISFGLPAAGREVLNAVFLYHCVQAGLDLAIVNSEKLERYASLPEEERRLSEDLLFTRGEDPVAAFAAHFRDKPTEALKPRERLPLDERLSRYIIDGSKDGLYADLDEARQTLRPLEIINGPLMRGMDEVGRLFNGNQLIVAEVLQSAEAMKAAVGHLEPYMEKHESASHGKMLLATVKGDVHDIGKNLVDIIFTNNGYKVINLGIKCLPETLIQAHREHQPDLIGLSGLLVKSAQQMVVTADDLKTAGVSVPMLVGGAALSRVFTRTRIAPRYPGMVVYASDAMSGLELAGKLRDPEARERLRQELEAEDAQAGAAPEAPRPAEVFPAVRSSRVRVDLPVPSVPDVERHILPALNLDEIWAYLNPQMLYGKHLGLRGNSRSLLEKKDPKALELRAVVEELQQVCRKGGMKARAVWQFLPARSEGNRMELLNPAGGAPLATFNFPRQQRQDGLSLSDFVLPGEADRRDHVGVFVVTAGEGIRELAEDYKNKGEYLRSHVLQALALETAEASAEWMHTQMRALWGYPDPAGMTMTQRFQAKYHGKRYSFGYPACPDLADQEPLFRLLRPEDIGVHLTEGHMMDPEASVSAVVFHHPDAAYFSVGKDLAGAETAGTGPSSAEEV